MLYNTLLQSVTVTENANSIKNYFQLIVSATPNRKFLIHMITK